VSHIVVLEKDKMAVCVDGEQVDVEDEFVDEGAEQNFKIADHDCCILTRLEAHSFVLEHSHENFQQAEFSQPLSRAPPRHS
jgi:hypothetical protein